jgi:hypothetical protein
MPSILGVLLISLLTTIDNALLAGLLLPKSTSQDKRVTLIVVGVLLGAVQILLAASVDQMLNNLLFRLFAIGLLGWMCIRTLGMMQTRHVEPRWMTIAKLWIYTVVGNLDNMFWLGSTLKGDRLWLILSSIGTIPLFVLVALFLAHQCEKQQWILPFGAGMMAWAAAALILDTPLIATFIYKLDDAPRTTFQYLIAIGILLIGLGLRQLFWSQSGPTRPHD